MTAPEPTGLPTTTSDGAVIYGDTAPPGESFPVHVRFWREDEPEVWTFNARASADIQAFRRLGGFITFIAIQQARDEQRRAAAAAGQEVALDSGTLDEVRKVTEFIGTMFTDRDGVKKSWAPTPLDRPADTPTWTPSNVRLPQVKGSNDFDGSICAINDPRVTHAMTLEAASSKRRWDQLIEQDDEVALTVDTVMQLVNDLIGRWAGTAESGNPLDGQPSSGTPPTSPAAASGSEAGSPSPASMSHDSSSIAT